MDMHNNRSILYTNIDFGGFDHHLLKYIGFMHALNYSTLLAKNIREGNSWNGRGKGPITQTFDHKARNHSGRVPLC